MISIITAIHNGLAINKFYEASLKKYTVNPFELIIIDNASADGSAEFFENAGYSIVRNQQNYSYPYCQNQGIKIAQGNYLFFLNNDIVLGPRWDELLIQVAEKHKLDILSACDNGNVGDAVISKHIRRKWKRIKYSIMQLGIHNFSLNVMMKLMYGNWEKFCKKRYEDFNDKIMQGIIGDNVMMTKRGIEIVGLWDERIQSADFDLFMRVQQKIEQGADIKPCQIALGVYIHHFSRMTVKYAAKPAPFADAKNLIELKDKWTTEELIKYNPDKVK
ncbi:MAG: glycosyltransferase [Parafilimonas sp.]